jgi:predicted ATPase/class 3 adenylate cyclase
MPATHQLPSGLITFVFTDIEASTRIVRELGAEEFARCLVEHRRAVRRIVAEHGGIEAGTEGDAFFLVFEDAGAALAAAAKLRTAGGSGGLRVRVGVHSGEGLVVDDDYVGLDVHKAARICSAGHGGQALVSEATKRHAGSRTPLRDLGYHRLKDLGAAVRIYQLGDEVFPPLRALRRSNLPLQPNPLLGRERELQELIALARAHRLVTLTGPGGVGKTRLALALAAELSEQARDGAWWVPLAGVSDPDLVLPTIAQVIGASDGLVEFLADKGILLVLDNLEQVLDGAAARIADLLTMDPELRLIATSREALAIGAEQEYPVSVLEDQAAAELFITRARQVKPDFQPDPAVAEICARLDRLPLAIELAAARVRSITAVAILGRLGQRLALLADGRRDLPARQTTLRATIDWSYQLLSQQEREKFRAISVFEGSFDSEAAERVCDARLETIRSLVAKNLVRSTERGRLFMLETLHEYARELLTAAGETEALRRRHADWFLRLAADAAGALRGPEQRLWLQRLRADNDNLRAALAWTLDADLPRGLALAGTLFRPWHMAGRLSELVGWYERALLRRHAMDPSALAASLNGYGRALLFTAQNRRADTVLRESLALSRSSADFASEAEALNTLGSVLSNGGRNQDALRLHEEALGIGRRLGDRSVISRSLHLVGEVLRDLGHLDRAAAMLEEAATIDTERGDQFSAMTSLHSLGDLALDAGDDAAAEQHYRNALALCSELGDERSQVYCLAGLACVAAVRGDMRTAGRLWGAAEAVEERLGLRMLAKERKRYERVLDAHAGQPAFQAGRTASRGRPLEDVVRDLLADA